MKNHMTSNGFWKWRKVLKEVYCVTENISLSVWLLPKASSLKKNKKRERGSLPGSSYTNYYLIILVVKATLSAHMTVDAAQHYGVFC